MRYITKFILTSSFLFLFLVSPTHAGQITSTSVGISNTDTASLQQQIQDLLQLIISLQTQIANIQRQVVSIQIEFSNYLKVGSENEEVELLQKVLSTDTSLYPEGKITGYYGSLTEKAVKRFQGKHGIEQAGVVGPKTRAKLNSVYINTKDGTTSSIKKESETTYSEKTKDSSLYTDTVKVITLVPTVVLSANPTNVPVGGSTTISWTATGADVCYGHEGFAGVYDSVGSYSSGTLNQTVTYAVKCKGAGGKVIEYITVNVTQNISD